MKFRSLFSTSLIALALAGCNAGSTLPASTSSSPSTSVTQNYSNLASGQQQSLSAVNGVTPSLTLPTLTTPFSGSVTESSTVPSSIPTAFSAAGPVPQGTRALKSTVANSTPLLFVAFDPTATTTASGSLTASFTLSSAPSTSNNYYIAFFNGTAWDATDYTTAGTVNGNSISFTGALPAAGLTFNAGTNYAIVLYSVPAASSTVSAGSTVNGAFLDGTLASLTLPSVSGSTSVTGNYTAIGSASSLPTGTQTPTTGTFVGGVTASATSAFTLPSGSVFNYTLTPSSSPFGQTLTLYYVTTSGAPVALASQSLSSTSAVAGTISVPNPINVTTGTSYSFVAYEQ